jgi:hypothetical protein
MNRITTRWASVALAAAVAIIYTRLVSHAEAAEAARWAPAALARTPAYAWAYPSIISSFRMSGVAPPYARGILSYGLQGIFFERENYNYLYNFNTAGSLVSTVRLPGAVRLGDADFAPEGYPGCFAVVDEGSHELKAYTRTGSFYGVIRTLRSDVVGYGVGGHVTKYLYLGTRDGVVYRYTPAWSFLNSFATGVEIADLAAGQGYNGRWGDWLEVGPARAGEPIRAYRSGSFYGSFSLPGIRNCGAVAGYRSAYWCLRNLGTEIWVYAVDLGPLMVVEPASLGKVKALYK